MSKQPLFVEKWANYECFEDCENMKYEAILNEIVMGGYKLKNFNWHHYFKRLLILFAGLTIAHLGVTLFIQSNLGSDPFNVLIQGISRMSGLSHGTAHQIISFGILIVLIFIARSYVKAGTIVCMFFGGPIIDFFTWLLKGIINGQLPFILRILVLILGCVILAFGMTLVIKSEAGTGPNDLVSVVLSDKLKRPFGICRVCVDVSFVVIGFLLGGTFGIGTVICAFLVGPVADRFLPISEKIVKKLSPLSE